MAAKTPFRITPSLGPELTQIDTQFYWDTISDPLATPSYQLGSSVTGSDGHEYQFVKNGAVALASGATVTAPAGPTWVVVAGAGGFTAPVTVGAVAIPADSFMHVRKTAA